MARNRVRSAAHRIRDDSSIPLLSANWGAQSARQPSEFAKLCGRASVWGSNPRRPAMPSSSSGRAPLW